jgi:hypothetical protein
LVFVVVQASRLQLYSMQAGRLHHNKDNLRNRRVNNKPE